MLRFVSRMRFGWQTASMISHSFSMMTFGLESTTTKSTWRCWHRTSVTPRFKSSNNLVSRCFDTRFQKNNHTDINKDYCSTLAPANLMLKHMIMSSRAIVLHHQDVSDALHGCAISKKHVLSDHAPPLFDKLPQHSLEIWPAPEMERKEGRLWSGSIHKKRLNVFRPCAGT